MKLKLSDKQIKRIASVVEESYPVKNKKVAQMDDYQVEQVMNELYESGGLDSWKIDENILKELLNRGYVFRDGSVVMLSNSGVEALGKSAKKAYTPDEFDDVLEQDEAHAQFMRGEEGDEDILAEELALNMFIAMQTAGAALLENEIDNGNVVSKALRYFHENYQDHLARTTGEKFFT